MPLPKVHFLFIESGIHWKEEDKAKQGENVRKIFIGVIELIISHVSIKNRKGKQEETTFENSKKSYAKVSTYFDKVSWRYRSSIPCP